MRQTSNLADTVDPVLRIWRASDETDIFSDEARSALRWLDCDNNESCVVAVGWQPGPSPEGGDSGARSPHFTFGPPVATYIQYCVLKMWPSVLFFGSSWFYGPLLLNPGDGPAGNFGRRDRSNAAAVIRTSKGQRSLATALLTSCVQTEWSYLLFFGVKAEWSCSLFWRKSGVVLFTFLA